MYKRAAVSATSSCSSTAASSSSDTSKKQQQQLLVPSTSIKVLLSSGRPNIAAQLVFQSRDLMRAIHSCLLVQEAAAAMHCHAVLASGHPLDVANFMGNGRAHIPLENKEKAEEDKKKKKKKKGTLTEKEKEIAVYEIWKEDREGVVASAARCKDHCHGPMPLSGPAGPRCFASRWSRTREVNLYNYQCFLDSTRWNRFAVATMTTARLFTAHNPTYCGDSWPITLLDPYAFPNVTTMFCCNAHCEQLSMIRHPSITRLFFGIATGFLWNTSERWLKYITAWNLSMRHLYLDLLRDTDINYNWFIVSVIEHIANDTNPWYGRTARARVDVRLPVLCHVSTLSRETLRTHLINLLRPQRMELPHLIPDLRMETVHTPIPDLTRSRLLDNPPAPTMNLLLHSLTVAHDKYLFKRLMPAIEREASLAIAEDSADSHLPLTRTPHCTVQALSSLGEWNFVGVRPKGNGEFIFAPLMPAHLRVNSAEALAAGQMLLPDDIKLQWRTDALAPLPPLPSSTASSSSSETP